MPTGETLDRLAGHVLEVLVLLAAARHPDQLEALRQRPLVGQVVERGEQFAVSQVAGRTEDDQRGRADRQALEPFDQRVFLLELGGHGCALHGLSPPGGFR